MLPPKAERPPHTGSRRDRVSMLLAFATVVGLGSAFGFSKGVQLLMPGPLTSAHGAIEACSSCHTSSGSGKLSWLHGLVAGDRRADSKACLTCHKMPDTAFNAHGTSEEVLKQSTTRLTKVAAAASPAPQSARAQSAAFPAHDVVARGLSCATCHQEHQGLAFNLNKISNEQCRSCHVVKFDSFDGHHPKFEAYPFKRRTRIVYDHAGHFGKHYPELAKKDPAKRIPDTCATCHNSRDDKRIMAVAPFDRTCSGCHLNQILGKERASGPKGIAFLTVPGLDVQTLKAKNAPIGEWPDASEASLTPFMKVMISRSDRGRALIKTVDGLNLQDLTQANDAQIKAVTELAWEIKSLFHALIKDKASDVLGDLNIGGGATLSAGLVADLTASLPRDVVTSAQQEWLPSLATEMANRPAPGPQKQSSQNPKDSKGSASNEKPSTPEARKATPGISPGAAGLDAGSTGSANAKSNSGRKARSDNELPPPMRAGVSDGQTLAQSKDAAGENDAAAGGEDAPSANTHDETNKGRVLLPSGTPRSIRNKQNAPPEAADEKSETAKTKSGGKDAPSVEPAGSAESATKDTNKAAQPESPAAPADAANASNNATDQSDDLLFPTEAELRDMKANRPDEAAAKPPAADAKLEGSESAAPASGATANAPTAPAAGSDSAVAAPQTRSAPVISIGSDVDPESWAEYGGWYRQDFAIFYRPTGHKDKFIYSWLFLTGPQAPKDAKTPTAAVFNLLSNKEAQGSCTKCHSVDDNKGKGRMVNFSPASIESKQGQFTTFVHEPHFGIMENRGCLTCHTLEKDRAYLKSYEQGDPHNFASSFGAVKKDLCQSCHTSGMARQDCLLCHNYHVHGVVTPIISTKLPTQ